MLWIENDRCFIPFTLSLYNITFKFFKKKSRKDKNVGACKMIVYVCMWILSNLMLTVPQRESLTSITMTYDD